MSNKPAPPRTKKSFTL